MVAVGTGVGSAGRQALITAKSVSVIHKIFQKVGLF
jgi:hypothetical protein